MVSTRPLISMCSSPCTKLLVTLPWTPITIGVAVTFMFHSFFQFSSKVEVLISLFAFFSFNLRSARTAKSTIRHVPFLLLTVTWSGCLAEIRWSVCISKSHRILCVSFSKIGSWLCIYHLFVWLNLNFLRDSQWITFPLSYTLLVLIYCIRLLCDWSFHLF